MIEFTDSERAWHTEMRSLAEDEFGREVLVGLTIEETEFYVTYARGFSSGDRDRDSAHRGRYLELHERHELARRQITLAENEARRNQSSRH